MQRQDDDNGEEERALFRRAMQDVRPLKGSQRIPAARRATLPRAAFARAERAAVLRESLGEAAASELGMPPGPDLFELQAGDELVFRRPGVPDSELRRLRRGHYRIDAELDLHGCTLAQARLALGAFLQQARARQLHCVRIIHGKGLRSGTRGPVLKNWVNAQLRRAAPVLAFSSARPIAGGTGATLVLLARA